VSRSSTGRICSGRTGPEKLVVDQQAAVARSGRKNCRSGGHLAGTSPGRKQAEESLRSRATNSKKRVNERTAELSRERRLLRTLIDNLPDCIYAKDAAGRKTMANPADLKNLRCQTEAEAIGKSDFDLFPKDIAEQFWADDQKVIQGQPVINREEHFFDETGRKTLAVDQQAAVARSGWKDCWFGGYWPGHHCAQGSGGQARRSAQAAFGSFPPGRNVGSGHQCPPQRRQCAEQRQRFQLPDFRENPGFKSAEHRQSCLADARARKRTRRFSGQ